MGHAVVSCGKAHAYCGKCRPDVAGAIAAAKRTPEARVRQSVISREYNTAAAMLTAEARENSTAAKRSPIGRAVRSAASRRYFATDPMTGGAQVPGALRDALAEKQAAYAARAEE